MFEELFYYKVIRRVNRERNNETMSQKSKWEKIKPHIIKQKSKVQNWWNLERIVLKKNIAGQPD